MSQGAREKLRNRVPSFVFRQDACKLVDHGKTREVEQFSMFSSRKLQVSKSMWSRPTHKLLKKSPKNSNIPRNHLDKIKEIFNALIIIHFEELKKRLIDRFGIKGLISVFLFLFMYFFFLLFPLCKMFNEKNNFSGER